MASSKVEMSLDDIIKANKVKKRPQISAKSKGKRGVVGKQRNSLKGVTKRKSTGPAGTSKAQSRRSNPPVNTATKKLVQKLVKKALQQKQQQQVVRSLVVPVARRRASVMKKTIMLSQLSRISPRSRVINRRQRVAVLPQPVKMVRSRVPIVYESPARPAVVKIQRRRNYDRPIIVQQPRQIYQLAPQPRRGGASIRDQVRAIRQQEVVYVQPRARQFVQPRRREVYVQQPIHRRPQQGRFARGRPNQNRRVYSKDDVVPDPPNFLQRLPENNNKKGSSRRFVY